MDTLVDGKKLSDMIGSRKTYTHKDSLVHLEKSVVGQVGSVANSPLGFSDLSMLHYT